MCQTVLLLHHLPSSLPGWLWYVPIAVLTGSPELAPALQMCLTGAEQSRSPASCCQHSCVLLCTPCSLAKGALCPMTEDHLLGLPKVTEKALTTEGWG